MKFVFFTVSENGENGLWWRGWWGQCPSRIFGIEPPLPGDWPRACFHAVNAQMHGSTAVRVTNLLYCIVLYCIVLLNLTACVVWVRCEINTPNCTTEQKFWFVVPGIRHSDDIRRSDDAAVGGGIHIRGSHSVHWHLHAVLGNPRLSAVRLGQISREYRR